MTPLSVNSALKLDGSPFDSFSVGEREVLGEAAFKRMIAIERKRTERSKEPFLLVLLDSGTQQGAQDIGSALDRMAAALLASSRETDVIGWYQDRVALGVLYTGLEINDKKTILSAILTRVKTILREELIFDQFNQVSISFHFYPDEWGHSSSGQPSNTVLYPDLFKPSNRKRSLLVVKQVIDVAVSALALLLCSPLFLAIALAIKMTSKGPVFFRQQRVGQYGKCFTFLKFRSMHVDNDHSIHEAFVTKMINDAAGPEAVAKNGVYKLTDDKRITPVGGFLRRTSLDELPQFLNVLKGDMSLVGPRPAIPYELAAYQTWHRRRMLEAKPGITGLWQIAGRGRVKFEEMVRMDLRYAAAWSPWLDIKILMRTPLAVIRGTGAY